MNETSNDNTSWFDALGKPVSQTNRQAGVDFLLRQHIPMSYIELVLPLVVRAIERDEPAQASGPLRELFKELWGHESETLVMMTLAYLTAPIDLGPQILPVEEIQDSFEHREFWESHRNPGHVEPCFVCGRGLTHQALKGAWHVHLAGGGSYLLPVDAPDETDGGDMGWFPVGSSCYERIPETHREKLTD